MSENALNLALRFALELAALAALGYWGWTTHTGLGRGAWSVGAVIVAAFAWGIFRVPGDGGDPVIAVPGWARLLLELALFVLAVLALFDAERPTLGIVLAAVAAVHYALSYDRVLRLLGLN